MLFSEKNYGGAAVNKSESKFHNTAVKFDNALLRLLEKKDFKDITISDICNGAGVNRSTFYSHYENTYDLLEEVKNNSIAEFMESFHSDLEVNNLSKYDSAELIFVSPKYLIPYLEFIRDNKRFFKVYMSNLDNFAVEDTNNYLVDTVFTPIYAKNGITDKTIIKYMSRYYLSGITAIVTEWVKNDCEDDILLISEIITICVRPNNQINVSV